MSGLSTSVLRAWVRMKEDGWSRNDEYISAPLSLQGCVCVYVHVQVCDECTCMLSACGISCVTKINVAGRKKWWNLLQQTMTDQNRSTAGQWVSESWQNRIRVQTCKCPLIWQLMIEEINSPPSCWTLAGHWANYTQKQLTDTLSVHFCLIKYS